MPLTSTEPTYAFLQGGGEMGALTRAFNWLETSLGMPDKWPQSLRTTLGIVLHSAFPMFLFWGKEFTCFYNDAYRPSLGTNGKHPALGKPAKEVWPEIWAFIGPLIDKVLATAEPVWFEDQLVPIYRNGQLEDVYWTFSYSPAYGDDGQIEGVLVTCTETTEKVINAKLQQEMTDLLRAVFNGTAAGISVFRSVRNEAGAIMDFEYQLANRVTEQINNRTDLVGKRALTVHQQFKQAGIFDDFITVIETGQTIERDRHYTGEGFDNWYTTVTVKHDDGVVFSFLDITAERTARQQVEESEQRFQAAIDAVQGILWTNNAKGEMEGDQPGWAALTGQTYEEYQGYGWANAVYPDDAQPTVDAWQEALKQRGTFVFEHRVRVKNGNWESFSIRAIPLMNPDGSIREWVGVHTNITERVLAQQRIEQSQQQLLALFEQSPVGIAILSEDNLTFRMANSFYGQLVGRKPEEIIDKPLLEALPELKGQGFDELLRQVIQTGVPFIANEVAVDVVRHNQLETIYVDFAYQPQREADTNHISSVFAIVTDVTQQVRSRQQVETSEAKLRSVVETAPVAIGLFMGRDLVVELPNQTFIDIVGKGPDIVGRPLREVMPELLTENQPFLQILDDVFTSGKQFHSFGSQVKIVQQGVMTYNYYNITYSPLFNEVGEVYAILDIAVDVTGQVVTQQELARQKTYLQNAIDIADLGTYQVDVTTNVGHYTDKIQQWFGLEQLEQPMDIVFSKVHPDDRTTVEQTIADTLLTEDRSRHDITYRLADASGKTTRYLRSIGKALFADGQPYAINGILQDVTPQIEARQAIETNEVKLRSLVESAPFPIGVYAGREMCIQLANQSILDVWGKGNGVIGKLYNEILPELANQSIFDQLDAVYTTGIPFHAKNQRVDIVVDGVLQPFYFNYSFTPLFDAAGQVYGVMNTAADITELATAKQQVEEVEVALRGAIDLAELGTWQIDLTTGILNYSERLRGWFGIGNNEIITAERAYRPVLPADRARVRAAITHAITPGTDGIYDIEYALDPAEAGQERILHIQGKAFVNEKGEAYKLSGTAQDVTKERRVQQELERQVQERTRQLQASVLDLERSNQNLQQFAYIASHDLQEPLRKIQSFGDILKTQHADSLGEGLDLLQRMQVAASRMSVLIKDLLAFSRISTRQEAASAVSLNQVVHTVLTDLELTVQETDAVIDIGPLPTVQGDASQLGQLFQNLLSNALKFRRPDPSGKLVSPVIQMKAQQVPAADLPASVRPTREAATYQRIDVIDNGIGFNQKYVDRIFQVFQRLHGRKEFAGTGVGLAICEKVVANHGGAITATSQPGQGATFSVYLPIPVK